MEYLLCNKEGEFHTRRFCPIYQLTNYKTISAVKVLSQQIEISWIPAETVVNERIQETGDNILSSDWPCCRQSEVTLVSGS